MKFKHLVMLKENGYCLVYKKYRKRLVRRILNNSYMVELIPLFENTKKWIEMFKHDKYIKLCIHPYIGDLIYENIHKYSKEQQEYIIDAIYKYSFTTSIYNTSAVALMKHGYCIQEYLKCNVKAYREYAMDIK